MRIKKFEDIKAWQGARDLVNMIYKAIRDNNSFYRDFRFREQIQAAGISVMSNIAEGFARSSDREFKRFLWIAKGSVAEVQSQLYVAFDQGYITQDDFDKLYVKAEEVAKLISGFITYLLDSKTQKTKQTQRLRCIA